MNVDQAAPITRHDRGEDFRSLDEPLVVSPDNAWRMLDCSNSHGYALLRAGELESFLSGRSRKITVARSRLNPEFYRTLEALGARPTITAFWSSDA